MTLEGVVSILEGMNPRMLETKLCGYFDYAQLKTAGKSKSERNPTRWHAKNMAST